MLNIDDIVDGEIVNGEWEGTKTLDKLLSVFNANIEAQRDSLRITDSEYWQLYVSGLIDIMKQSIDFEDRKLMNDAQIRSIDKDIEIKDEQIKLTYAERIIKDKEASLLGLDKVLQTVGANPENVYTIKYNM